MAIQQSSLSRAPRPSSLADVLDLILDKGLVIDAYIRISVIGIEAVTIDARVVIASVDTYLRFAEAVNRLDLTETETAGLKELQEGFEEKGAESKTKGALEGGMEAFGIGKKGKEEKEEEETRGGSRGNGRGRGEGGGRSRRRSNDEDEEEEEEDRGGGGVLSKVAAKARDRAKWS
jgi:gas vesicle structural protein